MSREEFDPSHVLLFGSLSADPDRERTVTRDLVAAAADRAATVRLHVDLVELADEHPDVAASVRETCDRIDPAGPGRPGDPAAPDVDDGVALLGGGSGGREWYGAPAAEGRAALSSLLSVESWHRQVSLGTVEALSRGICLRYVPDHRRLAVDLTDRSALSTALRERLAGLDAGLLPAETLAEWHRDGRTYRVDPPDLCFEADHGRFSSQTCLDLSRLSAVTVDAGERTIGLEWATGGVLWRAADLVVRRPTTLGFDDERSFRSAVEAFRRVAAARESVPIERR